MHSGLLVSPGAARETRSQNDATFEYWFRDSEIEHVLSEIGLAPICWLYQHRAMTSEEHSRDDEQRLVAASLHGDRDALTSLWERYRPYLLRVLAARGATEEDAADVVNEVWADIVPCLEHKPSRLEKYKSQYSLRGWLSTVVTNLWVDKVRRKALFVQPAVSGGDDTQTDFLARMPGDNQQEAEESALIDMLCASLRAAFAGCDDEALVMLRLVYIHNLSQREIARMFVYHETKVSRMLSAAMKKIREAALDHLRRQDPWLKLEWDDFVALCQAEQVTFF